MTGGTVGESERAADWSPFFADCASRAPAEIVLQQVSDDRFRLDKPFWYCPVDGDPIKVTDEELGETDLTSVPFFASWFVSRHGRHTPAALLHDQLVGAPKRQQRVRPVSRVQADRLFLKALDGLGVPPVRSRAMWAAVVIGTRWDEGRALKAGLVVWGLLAVGGTGLLVLGVRQTDPLMLAIGALGPFIGATLYGRDYWAGVVAGYALWFVLLPAAATFVGKAIYDAFENVVRISRALIHRRPVREFAGPARLTGPGRP